MMNRILNSPAAGMLKRVWGRLPPPIRESRSLSGAVVAILLAVLYWGVIASDRYVSNTHVVIDRTDAVNTTTADFSSLLGMGGSNRDLMLLRDYLLSIDMAEKLDKRLHLRAHYSDWRRDPISRLWFENGPREWYYQHYLSRVSAEVDDVSGVLRIRVQAYDPVMAQAIGLALVEEGERFMNSMVHGLAREQVKFLEEEVVLMGDRLGKARAALIAYQDQHGLVSPQSTVEGLSSIINSLEGELTKLRSQRGALLGYLSPGAPDVVQLDLQIRSMERQLASERGRLASPQGKALNSVADEYQRLQMEAEFALDIYRSALVALQKGRVDATRVIKKVSVVQAPSLPDRAQEPQRIYNTVVFILLTLLLAGIVRLLAAIIRDHKD